ncbi:SGNH/GDSL hydrolase family protein [Geodermatophilus sp. SYSU D00815]
MRGLGLERPPRWFAAALVVLVLGTAAVLVLLIQKQESLTVPSTGEYAEILELSADPGPSGSTTAPTSTATAPAAPEAPAAPPVLAVYGDGYAAGNEQGGLGPAGWPALVAGSTGTELALHAASQAGYASVGVGGQDYLGLVESAPEADAAVTLVVGSRNDRGQNPAVVRSQAAQVIASVRETAPGSVVVLVGPIWSDGAPPADLLAERDAVRAAAEAAGVGFVDPLATGWFAAPAGLISPDGVSPTDVGHAHLATLIAPVVTSALAQHGAAGN